QSEIPAGALPLGLLRARQGLGPLAVGDLHPAVGDAGDPDRVLDPLHVQPRVGRGELAHLPPHRAGRAELADRPAARDDDGDAGAHLEGAAVLDADPDGRAARHPEGALRGGERRRRDGLAEIQVRHLAVAAHALHHLDAALAHLDARRLQQRLPADRRPARGQDACPRHARHPLYPPRPARPRHGDDRGGAAVRPAVGVFHDAKALGRRTENVPVKKNLLREAKLWLVAIPVLLWTLIPIYHIFLFSIST